MAKKILTIDNRERRWRILHNFEENQNRALLRRLTIPEGLRLFLNLYQFAQLLNNKAYYRQLDLNKIRELSRVHSMFMKVTQ